jgi:hypothetical protein
MAARGLSGSLRHRRLIDSTASCIPIGDGAMTRLYDDYDDDEDHIDMRPVVRLGAWGICAIAALVAAVIAGRTEVGAERAEAALAALRTAPMDLLTRSSEAEAEAQRLAEAVRTLTADRDELAARVATLERNINDLTGSIARDRARSANPAARPDDRSDNAQPGWAQPGSAQPGSAQPGSAQPGSIATAVPPAAPLESANTEEIRSPVEQQPGVGQPANVPLPRPGPLATIQSYVSSTASPPPPATRVAEAPAGTDTIAAGDAATKEIAIDIATATNVNALRAKWGTISKTHPALLEGLRPLISVRASARPGFTEFHLVAGPIADAAAATRLCGALVAARVPCHPALFDGQRLDLR